MSFNHFKPSGFITKLCKVCQTPPVYLVPLSLYLVQIRLSQLYRLEMQNPAVHTDVHCGSACVFRVCVCLRVCVLVCWPRHDLGYHTDSEASH